jgi:hypothetical protein
LKRIHEEREFIWIIIRLLVIDDEEIGTPIDRKHQPLADQSDTWIISESPTSTSK